MFYVQLRTLGRPDEELVLAAISSKADSIFVTRWFYSCLLIQTMYLDPQKRHSVPDIWTVQGNHVSPRSRSPTIIPRVSISSNRSMVDYPPNRPPTAHRKNKSPLRRWCKLTGWHGILDCYQAENAKIRAFWGIIIIMTVLLGASQITSMLHDYWSEDQWVTNMHFVDAGPDGIPMPNVTLCSLNMFNQSYMDWLRIQPSTLMLSKAQNLYAFYQQYLSAKPIYPNTVEYNESIREDLASINQLIARFHKTMSVKQFLRNASHSCKASVLACGLTSDPTMENGVACCDKNFYESGDHCMHFSFFEPNGKPLYITNEASGIYLLLHPRLSDYNAIFLPENMPAAGFSITLSLTDNAGSIPVLISPGTHNVIWMTLEKRRTVSRRLLNAIQHLYHLTPPCTNNLAYKVLDEAHYNPESCRSDCLLQLSLTTCGCVLSTGQSVKRSFNICSTEQTVACGMQKSNSSHAIAQVRKCQARCIEPCKYGRIKLLHNSVTFPAPNKAVSLQRYASRVVGENFSIDDVHQFISVHIVYESMYIRLVEKFNRVSLDELISNIGGALGVWTGISLISIIQLFAYVWHCFCRSIIGHRDY